MFLSVKTQLVRLKYALLTTYSGALSSMWHVLATPPSGRLRAHLPKTQDVPAQLAAAPQKYCKLRLNIPGGNRHFTRRYALFDTNVQRVWPSGRQQQHFSAYPKPQKILFKISNSNEILKNGVRNSRTDQHHPSIETFVAFFSRCFVLTAHKD